MKISKAMRISQLKKWGFLSREISIKNPKITTLKKTPKPVSFQRVSTIQIDIPDDLLTISPQQTYISTRPFGIFVRRRSNVIKLI